MFLSKAIILLCFLIAGVAYYRIRNISSDLIENIDNGSIFYQANNSAIWGYSTLVCPIISVFLCGFFPSLEFMPFCVLLIYSIILFKFHGNTKSALLSEMPDAALLVSYGVCLGFIAFLNEENREVFYIIILSYYLVFIWHIIGMLDASKKLFRHYLAKSIKLEDENEELKRKLKRYESA